MWGVAFVPSGVRGGFERAAARTVLMASSVAFAFGSDQKPAYKTKPPPSLTPVLQFNSDASVNLARESATYLQVHTARHRGFYGCLELAFGRLAGRGKTAATS